MRQHQRQQGSEAVPVKKSGEGEQPGPPADLLVGETDLDGFSGVWSLMNSVTVW
ncbi:MAG: hypothetical protein H7A45_12570 [Verrucomicrobiales bacterium]|nr:hypothetical protein [Verrucomicrobiales bacterium]